MRYSLTRIVLHVDSEEGECAGRVFKFGVDVERLFDGLVSDLENTQQSEL